MVLAKGREFTVQDTVALITRLGGRGWGLAVGAEAAEAEAGAGAGGMRGLGAACTWKRAVTNAAEALLLLLLLLLRGGEFEEGMATQEE